MESKKLSGKKIGVLMLNTKFPRLVGDVGRYESFDYPIEYYFVEGANSKSVVLSSENLCDSFLKGAEILQANGCSVIATSCGFLIEYQSVISQKLSIPFVSSSLIQLNLLGSIFGSLDSIAIITADKNKLLSKKNSHANIFLYSRNIVGMEDTYFYKVYVENEITSFDALEVELLYNDILHKAKYILSKIKNPKAILMECTNMSPFRNRLSKELQIPVFDLITFLNYLHSNV